MQIRRLRRREDDLAAIYANVLKNLLESVWPYERQYESAIRDFDFQPGFLVLIRN